MGRLLQILLIAVLAVIAWRLVRQWAKNWLLPPDPPDEPSNDATFEPTARCESCGTYVPRNELDDAQRCPRCRKPGS